MVAFLDKDQVIAQAYEAKKATSHFYKHATFYTVQRISNLLKSTGFKDLEYTQTLFGNLDDIVELQDPQEGYGKGSFVVIKALKK